VDPPSAAGWLKVRADGDRQEIGVAVEASALAPGFYSARVVVEGPGAVHSPQDFLVRLTVGAGSPGSAVTVRVGDEGFACTPFFWVGHRLTGAAAFYRTNGGRPVPGEFMRFTPDLAAGTYDVSLGAGAPAPVGARFDVRVRHRSGEDVVRLEPARSRVVGRYEFEEGTGGFVEIRAEKSDGLVAAESVIFDRVEGGAGRSR
jgi:hypothetical protein